MDEKKSRFWRTKKWLLKLKIKKEFSLGDTHLEVKLNKKYMDQGEK